MKIWLPYIVGGSGTDVFTKILANGLRARGADVEIREFPHRWQYVPWLLRDIPPPPGTDVVLTNSWNGFAFARKHTRLIVVEHHCVFDPAYLPYRSTVQGLFHEGIVKRYELESFRTADAVVAVSNYTAKSLQTSLGITATKTIHNGIDCEFFSPASQNSEQFGIDAFRLLFVGNHSKRKGADMLLPIMRELGGGFQLYYTGGLRKETGLGEIPNAHALGRLNDNDLRDRYRSADALIFPSRLEGFGYAAAEAMACGTPVVATHSSSLPEIVVDDVTGYLCPQDDREAFVSAIRKLALDEALRARMGIASRNRAREEFSLDRMLSRYCDLFETLVEQPIY